MGWDKLFTVFGTVFILIGIALVLIPIIVRFIPEIELEKIPWILLYVYRKDNFLFATSPILIIISIIYYLWKVLAG